MGTDDSHQLMIPVNGIMEGINGAPRANENMLNFLMIHIHALLKQAVLNYSVCANGGKMLASKVRV